MEWNDTTNRDGLVQDMEDICGLGATGITGNSDLFKQFTRWANEWHKKAMHYALMAFDGHEADDPGYTTLPSGTFTGTTNRDYSLDSTYKMLKVKLLNVSYDGTNYVAASPIDSRDLIDKTLAVKDTAIDGNFTQTAPKYDLIANGFKLYPKFSSAQVTAGAKVYIEFFRAPRDFATSGTDSYEPGIDLQFHRLISLGPSYEYAKLFKKDLVGDLAVDIFGGSRNGVRFKGILNELEDWYSSKQPSSRRIIPLIQNNR